MIRFLSILLSLCFASLSVANDGVVLRTNQRGDLCTVLAPAGTTQLVLEQSNGRGWKPVVTRHFTSQSMKKARFQTLRKPKLTQKASYRVIAYKTKLFPERITQAPNTFEIEQTPSQAVDGSASVDSLAPRSGSTTLSVNSLATAGATDAATPNGTAQVAAQESDIWKIVGHRLFFFNQYRGLQVLDITNPVDPRRLGTLRLAASGEEFFVLDDVGSELVLIEKDTSDWQNPKTVLHSIAVSPAGVPQLLKKTVLRGSYVDSRLVGKRLTLVTVDPGNYGWGWWGRPIVISLKDALVPVNATVLSLGTAMVSEPKSHVHSLDFTNHAQPIELTKLSIDGQNVKLQASGGKILVASQTHGYWSGDSTLRVLAESSTGVTVENTFTASGWVQDKFKMGIHRGHLIAITQDHDANWGLQTLVSSYDLKNATGSHTDQLELVAAANEQLHATRFDADRLYVVTFRRIDPLFVVDLADPADLKLKGVLEIPGWSTYLIPLGDRLIGVGVEDRRVAVSLFDVQEVTDPKQLSRVWLGKADGWTWSEGNYDEKAIEFYPEAAALTLPFQTYDRDWKPTMAMQEVRYTREGLTLGKTLSHQHFARRGGIRGDYLISLSQKEYLAVNRNTPGTEPDVAISLAWDTTYLARRNGHLLQVDAADQWNQDGKPILRITREETPDELLEELELGTGQIEATREVGDYLYLLQFAAGKARTWQLDLRQLPLVPTPQSIDQSLPAGCEPSKWYANAKALTPKADTLCWYFNVQAPATDEARPFWYFWSWGQNHRAVLATLSIQNGRMTSGTMTKVSDNQANTAGVFASNGFIFASQNYWEPTAYRDAGGIYTYDIRPWINIVSLIVMDVRGSTPLIREPVDLPGDLFGVASVSSQGAVLFTGRSYAYWTGSNYETRISAAAYDGAEVWELDSLALPNSGWSQPTCYEGNVFVPTGDHVKGYTYNGTTGRLELTGDWQRGAATNSLSLLGDYLLASSAGRLDAAKLGANGSLTPAGSFELSKQYWVPLERGRVYADGIWLPVGAYGVEMIPWCELTPHPAP
jgi:hypothetical protein